MSQDDRDNHANQMNPNNDAYWSSRGDQDSDDDNRANQLNPNNSSYWSSREQNQGYGGF